MLNGLAVMTGRDDSKTGRDDSRPGHGHAREEEKCILVHCCYNHGAPLMLTCTLNKKTQFEPRGV